MAEEGQDHPPVSPPAVPVASPGVSPEEFQALRTELATLRARDEGYQAERQRLEQLEQQFGQIRQVFIPGSTQDQAVEYFTNPQAHLARVKEEAKAESLAEARRERFWEGFYDRNEDLQGLESFVLDTIRSSEDLSKLAYTPAAAKQLAEAVKARLTTIAGGAPAPAGSAGGVPAVRLVEGGGGARPPGGQAPAGDTPEQPTRPKGVSDLIRAQREARRKAAQGA